MSISRHRVVTGVMAVGLSWAVVGAQEVRPIASGTLTRSQLVSLTIPDRVPMLDAILHRDPAAEVVVTTDANGVESLVSWAHPTVAEPSAATLETWQTDPATIAAVRQTQQDAPLTEDPRWRVLVEAICAEAAVRCDAETVWQRAVLLHRQQ